MRDAISNVLNKAVDDEIINSNVSLKIKIAQKIRNGDDGDGNGEAKDPLTQVGRKPKLMHWIILEPRSKHPSAPYLHPEKKKGSQHVP